MFILKKGHQPGVYVPLRALFLVNFIPGFHLMFIFNISIKISMILAYFWGKAKSACLVVDVAYCKPCWVGYQQ